MRSAAVSTVSSRSGPFGYLAITPPSRLLKDPGRADRWLLPGRWRALRAISGGRQRRAATAERAAYGPCRRRHGFPYVPGRVRLGDAERFQEPGFAVGALVGETICWRPERAVRHSRGTRGDAL